MRNLTRIKPEQQEDIFNVFGGSNIAEKEKDDLLARMLLLNQQRVFTQVMDSLPDKVLLHLENVKDGEKKRTLHLEGVIEKYIPTYGDFYAVEVRKVCLKLIAKSISNE